MKPVLTRQIEQKALEENNISSEDRFRTYTLLEQLRADGDLAWFEAFLTDGSVRVVVKAMKHYEQISKDITERMLW